MGFTRKFCNAGLVAYAIRDKVSTSRYASPGGGIIFSKIDLKNAYSQLVLDENSRELTTISTHLGLFRFKSLVYGLKSALRIFSEAMHTSLEGLKGTVIFP